LQFPTDFGWSFKSNNISFGWLPPRRNIMGDTSMDMLCHGTEPEVCVKCRAVWRSQYENDVRLIGTITVSAAGRGGMLAMTQVAL
jgi:hypothetical protein